jgi:hypothetical protein
MTAPPDQSDVILYYYFVKNSTAMARSVLVFVSNSCLAKVAYWKIIVGKQALLENRLYLIIKIAF